MSFARLLGKVGPTTIASLCFCSLLLLLTCILGHLDRPGARSAKSLVTAGATRFAIADFDGDSQPDTATIRVARDSSPLAEYFLELQLSSGSRPAIEIVGPAGGLRVASQDVNGDKIADLVVTAALDAHFVTILLNDGMGNFRRVASSDFPNVGKSPESRVLSAEVSNHFQLTLEQKRSTDGREVTGGRAEEWPEKGTQLLGSGVTVPRNVAMHASASRAPPLV